MVDVLPTTTTTTTFIYMPNIGIGAMDEVHGKHAYSWGRAVGADPSALLDLQFREILMRSISERPLTPLEIDGFEKFFEENGFEYVYWFGVHSTLQERRFEVI
jgi:hypothetical protein